MILHSSLLSLRAQILHYKKNNLLPAVMWSSSAILSTNHWNSSNCQKQSIFSLVWYKHSPAHRVFMWGYLIWMMIMIVFCNKMLFYCVTKYANSNLYWVDHLFRCEILFWLLLASFKKLVLYALASPKQHSDNHLYFLQSQFTSHMLMQQTSLFQNIIFVAGLTAGSCVSLCLSRLCRWISVAVQCVAVDPATQGSTARRPSIPAVQALPPGLLLTFPRLHLDPASRLWPTHSAQP